jgi:hypothetical protein
MFPYLYGGSQGDTNFTAVDFDKAGNIAAGGYSSDSSITSGASQTPIIVYYQSDTSIGWAKTLSLVTNSDSNTVSSVAFSTEASSTTAAKVAISLGGGGQLILVTLNTSDGSI